MDFRISARIRLGLLVVQRGRCGHQRRQEPDGTGAMCLAHLDEHGQHAQKRVTGGDRAKLHDVGCHIVHNASCEAGLKSQREMIVPTLATEKLTEPRVGVNAWGHPKLPHIQLDFTARLRVGPNQRRMQRKVVRPVQTLLSGSTSSSAPAASTSS